MTLNFDIIAIVIVLLSIGFAYGRGFFKQLKITLAIIAPFIAIALVKDMIFSFVDGIGFVDTIANAVAKILGYFTNITAADTKLLLIYTVLFIVVGLVVQMFVGFFSPSKKKNIVTFKSKASKWVGASLGLVRGVCLVVITLFLMKEIAIIDVTSPITGALLNLITPILGDIMA